jgi:hypothetical protein
MNHPVRTTTLCLTHQLVEDQTSPVGLVCRQCKQRLDTHPPTGRCRSFWESQPAAYSMARKPCFVYSLMWDDFRIRSLHPPNSQNDPRGEKVKELPALTTSDDDSAPRPAWLDDFRIEREQLNDFDVDDL